MLRRFDRTGQAATNAAHLRLRVAVRLVAVCALALAGCGGRADASQPHLVLPLTPVLRPWELLGSVMWGSPSTTIAGFHPQSGLAVILSRSSIRLWDPDTGHVASAVPAEMGSIRWATMSASGQRIAVGGRVLDVTTGAVIAAVHAPSAGPNGVALNADGTRLATRRADTGVVSVWDVATGDRIREFPAPHGTESVALTPDGSAVAVPGGSRFGVQTWDIASGKPLAVYDGHEGAIRAIRFTSDGERMITGSDDGTARLWGVASHEVIREFGGSAGAIRSLALDRGGRLLATGSDESEAAIWDLETGERLQRHSHGHRPIYSLSLSPNGLRLATRTNTVRVWDLARPSRVVFPPPVDIHTELLAVSPDGRRAVTGSRDGSADLWDIESRTYVGRLLLGGSRGRPSARFSGDSARVLVVQRSSDASLFDGSSGAPLQRVLLAANSYALPATTSDLSWMATADGADVTMWDLPSGQRLGGFSVPQSRVLHMVLSPRGNALAMGLVDGTVHTRDMESGNALHPFAAASRMHLNITHVSGEGLVIMTSRRDGGGDRV